MLTPTYFNFKLRINENKLSSLMKNLQKEQHKHQSNRRNIYPFILLF